MNKSAPHSSFSHSFLPERVVKLMRTFFDQQDFQEVLSPVLNRNLPLEPNLYAFSTDWYENIEQWRQLSSIFRPKQGHATQQSNTSQSKQPHKFYLPISHEPILKKVLAAGVEQCYSIGPVFRNLEPADEQHRPEFLMLEWYRAGANYQQLMQDTQQLVLFLDEQLGQNSQAVWRQPDQSQPWPQISLAAKFAQVTGTTIKQVLKLPQLKQLAQKFNYQVTGASWEALFNQIVVGQIEPALPQTPFFLIDYPSKISPMCRPKQDQPHLCERFEFYLAGVELANGNTELLDAQAMQASFEQEQAYRQQQHLPSRPLDHQYLQTIEALKQQPQSDFAGIGLGVERLAMLLTSKSSLAELGR